nr:MAG TPA: hypothetical protein [Caudoviricetes sp.]
MFTIAFTNSAGHRMFFLNCRRRSRHLLSRR